MPVQFIIIYYNLTKKKLLFCLLCSHHLFTMACLSCTANICCSNYNGYDGCHRLQYTLELALCSTTTIRVVHVHRWLSEYNLNCKVMWVHDHGDIQMCTTHPQLFPSQTVPFHVMWIGVPVRSTKDHVILNVDGTKKCVVYDNSIRNIKWFWVSPSLIVR